MGTVGSRGRQGGDGGQNGGPGVLWEPDVGAVSSPT